MDWHLAIETNREALKGILVMLVAMAGLVVSGVDGGEGISGGSADPGAGGASTLPRNAAPKTLPRHLHRLVLRLLRPAEAAARRLIIVAARGLVVELAPPRVRNPQPQALRNRSNGFGTGIVIRPGPLPDWAQKLAPKRSASLSLPLFDPLKRFGTRRRRFVRASAAPRIRSFDEPRVPFYQQPRAPSPPPPTPDDPLDAGRLARRLEALASALDDLPRQAKRLARWRARRDAAAADLPASGGDVRPLRQAQDKGGCEGALSDATAYAAAIPAKPRVQRFSPMRPGRPPGWRRRPDHPVYEVLNDLHGLAFWAMERPDTS